MKDQQSNDGYLVEVFFRADVKADGTCEGFLSYFEDLDAAKEYGDDVFERYNDCEEILIHEVRKISLLLKLR